MTAADWIDNLAQLAEAATPGPWYAHGPVFGPNPGAIGQTWGPTRRNDAKFIAAANPTNILRLIEDNRRMRHGSLCPECNAKAWGERADFRRERDELAARLAAVEALADRWRHCGDPGDPRRQAASALRAVLSTAPTDTTKET